MHAFCFNESCTESTFLSVWLTVYCLFTVSFHPDSKFETISSMKTILWTRVASHSLFETQLDHYLLA